MTTLDTELQRDAGAAHLRARRAGSRPSRAGPAGVPVGVLVAPVIPGLTDHEIPAIVAAAAAAGARRPPTRFCGLPHAVAPLFEEWLTRHFPERRTKVMGRIRAVRDGRVNDPRFHSRMTGHGIFAEQVHALFELACRRAGLVHDPPPLSTRFFRQTNHPQLALFSGD